MLVHISTYVIWLTTAMSNVSCTDTGSVDMALKRQNTIIPKSEPRAERVFNMHSSIIRKRKLVKMYILPLIPSRDFGDHCGMKTWILRSAVRNGRVNVHTHT